MRPQEQQIQVPQQQAFPRDCQERHWHPNWEWPEPVQDWVYPRESRLEAQELEQESAQPAYWFEIAPKPDSDPGPRPVQQLVREQELVQVQVQARALAPQNWEFPRDCWECPRVQEQRPIHPEQAVQEAYPRHQNCHPMRVQPERPVRQEQQLEWGCPRHRPAIRQVWVQTSQGLG